MQSSYWTTTTKTLEKIAGRSTRRILGLIGLMMIVTCILLWIYIIDKSNNAKKDYEDAEDDEKKLADKKNLIASAARSLKLPTSGDEAYSMISDSWWPAILVSSIAFIAAILLIFQWVYLALKNKNAF